MKKYSTPDFEVIFYTADDVLESSKPVDDSQKNGVDNAEGIAAGWTIEDLV